MSKPKSRIEAYLTATLPFGGQHVDAAADLSSMVPRRLEKNKKLHRRLGQGMRHVWQTSPGGVLLPAMTLPFDGAQLEQWAAYVARGLVWYHWQTIVPADHVVSAASLSREGVHLFASLFAMNAKGKVDGNLAGGRFIYRGAQGTDDASLTVWEISVLGSTILGDDPSALGETSTRVGVVTGSKRIGNLFAALGVPPVKPAA